MKKINIIGAGKAGSSLAIILNNTKDIELGAICDCEAAQLSILYDKVSADNFITSIHDLPAADINLITTPDDLIVDTCKEILNSQDLRSDTIFAHCSGALPSSVLKEVVNDYCSVASVHPIKSFAQPERAAETFAGTYCGFEGDEHAVNTLKIIFNNAKANCFDIDPSKKSLYHSAAVLSCNYLNTLVEIGLKTYEKAGVDRAISSKIIGTIAKDTLHNIFESTPAEALTGPIARGDVATIMKHVEALKLEDDEPLLEVYKTLGKATLPLSAEQGSACAEDLLKIDDLLN